MPLLEIKGLSKSFGGLMTLFNLDFEVYEKEIVGLIGPNGSGKTTLFNKTMGSLKCDQGSILFRNEDITGFNLIRFVRKGSRGSFS